MARSRYRPKLPESLQAAEHDAYALRLGIDAVDGALENAAEEAGFPGAMDHPGSMARIIAGGVIVALVILTIGLLLD